MNSSLMMMLPILMKKFESLIADVLIMFIPYSIKPFLLKNHGSMTSSLVKFRRDTMHFWRGKLLFSYYFIHFHYFRNHWRDFVQQAEYTFTEKNWADLLGPSAYKVSGFLHKILPTTSVNSLFLFLYSFDGSIFNNAAEKANLFDLLFPYTSTLYNKSIISSYSFFFLVSHVFIYDFSWSGSLNPKIYEY